MGELLEKRIVQVGLGAVVVLVWGYNMLKIADIAGPAETDNTSGEIIFDRAFFELPDLLQYDYEADFRDPFTPGLTRPKRRSPIQSKPKSPPKQIRFPELKLTGVIEGTALLQNSRQAVFFVAPGDTVEEAQVKAVTPDSVVLVFKSKEFSVKF